MALIPSIDSPTVSDEPLATIGQRINYSFETLAAIINLEHEKGSLWVALENESQRFHLWATNLGLYHTGHSSLDYRFRDAPLVYSFAQKLLKDLERYLFIGKIGFLRVRTPRHEQSQACGDLKLSYRGVISK